MSLLIKNKECNSIVIWAKYVNTLIWYFLYVGIGHHVCRQSTTCSNIVMSSFNFQVTKCGPVLRKVCRSLTDYQLCNHSVILVKKKKKMDIMGPAVYQTSCQCMRPQQTHDKQMTKKLEQLRKKQRKWKSKQMHTIQTCCTFEEGC